jgi:hypothetical protein
MKQIYKEPIKNSKKILEFFQNILGLFDKNPIL